MTTIDIQTKLKALPDSKKAEDTFVKLEEHNLSAVFDKYLKNADTETLSRFFEEACRLDFKHLDRHRETLHNPLNDVYTAQMLDPAKADPDQHERKPENIDLGKKSLSQGKWAVAVFAGGSGTRFTRDWPKLAEAMPVANEAVRKSIPQKNAPKGVFPISPVMGLSFYEKIIAEVLETSIGCGRLIPILFMTSGVTHRQTSEWIEKTDLWGYPKRSIILMKQAEIPRLDEEGDLIALPDGSLLWTGNGHGGIYQSMMRKDENGESVIERLGNAGICHIIMGNVDNAALAPTLPERLGQHIRRSGRFTLTVIRRSDPDEKVGMACWRKDNGRFDVIEYSVLDPVLSAAPDPDGGLLFDCGHANTNIVSLDAVHSDLPGTLYTGKPVEVDGKVIESSTYELLNQHLPCTMDPEDIRLFEGNRDDIFLPTKNMIGKDSVQTTVAALSRLTAMRLRNCGALVAGSEQNPKAMLELHPCLGMEDVLLQSRGLAQEWQIEEDARLYLCARHGLESNQSPFSKGLHLGRGSSLIITTELPYGEIGFDPDTGKIIEKTESAGKLHIGKNVSIADGIKVSIQIIGNGNLCIPESTRIEKNVDLTIEAGKKIKLDLSVY